MIIRNLGSSYLVTLLSLLWNFVVLDGFLTSSYLVHIPASIKEKDEVSPSSLLCHTWQTVLHIPVGQTWIHGHSSCKGRGRNFIPAACAFSCRSGILLLSKKGRMGIGRQLGDSHIDIQEKLYKGSWIRSYRISYSKGYTFWSHQPL